MKFTFDYEETLLRRVAIDADSLEDALSILHRKLDKEEIVLGAEDFAAAEIRMPCEENFLPKVQCYGDSLQNVEGLEIVIEYW